MGLKLEILLIAMIIVIVTATTMVELTNRSSHKTISHKELEFTNTTFIEVDSIKMQAKALSTYGVREKGVLTLEHLKYYTTSIEELLANKGTYKENILYLDGNVSLYEKDGFEYSTQHAKYNQKTEILYITSPFVSKMDKNTIHGTSLQYNAVKKEAHGTGIDAVVYTVDK